MVQKDVDRQGYSLMSLDISVVVNIMVFWALSTTRHLINGYPKRDHNSNNHTYVL